jgi:hypothetical protein
MHFKKDISSISNPFEQAKLLICLVNVSFLTNKSTSSFTKSSTLKSSSAISSFVFDEINCVCSPSSKNYKRFNSMFSFLLLLTFTASSLVRFCTSVSFVSCLVIIQTSLSLSNSQNSRRGDVLSYNSHQFFNWCKSALKTLLSSS